MHSARHVYVYEFIKACNSKYGTNLSAQTGHVKGKINSKVHYKTNNMFRELMDVRDRDQPP